MATPLDARLLGEGQFMHRGISLDGLGAKERALIAFLAVEARACSREELAELLWGPGGLPNLRQALHRIRRQRDADEWLSVANDSVRVTAGTDLAALDAAWRRGSIDELRELPSTHRVLDGLRIPGDLPIHEWIGELRTRVEVRVRWAWERRARDCWASGLREEALALAERVGITLEEIPARTLPSTIEATEVVRGRERELAWIRRQLDTGARVVLRGPAGIGKSTLARRACPDAIVVRARDEDLHTPHAPFVRFLRHVATEVPSPIRPVLAHRAPDAFPDVVPIHEPSATQVAKAERALGGALDLRTLVLDGLERFDPDSLRSFVRVLAGTDARQRCLVTHRPAAGPAATRELEPLVSGEHVQTLDLAPMGLAAFRRFISALAPNLDPRETYALTGGHPGLALDLVRHGELSTTSRERLVRRFRDLGDARPMLALVALTGEALRLDVFARALEREPWDLAEAANLLESDGWLDDRGTFDSELVRDAVVLAIGDAERRFLWGRWAEAIASFGAAPGEVARALTAAGRDAEAAPHWLAAARRALEASAPESAEACLSAARDPLPPRQNLERALLQAELARHRGDVTAEDASLCQAERLAELLQEDEWLRLVSLRRADERLRRRGAPEALRSARRAYAIADRVGDDSARRAAAALLGEAHLRAGALAEAEVCFAEAFDADEVATRVRGAWGLGACAGIANDVERAASLHRRGLTWARAAGLVELAQRLVNGLGATAERSHDYDEAAERFDEALALAEQRSDGEMVVASLLNRAEVLRKLGRLGDASAAIRLARARIAPSMPRALLVAELREATLASSLGRYDVSLAGFARSIELAIELGDERLAACARMNVALVRYERRSGDDDDVLREARMLESLGEHNIARWGRVELALHAHAHEVAEGALAVGNDSGPHMRFVVELARSRFGAPRPARARYLEAGLSYDGVVTLDGLDVDERAAWAQRCERFREGASLRGARGLTAR